MQSRLDAKSYMGNRVFVSATFSDRVRRRMAFGLARLARFLLRLLRRSASSFPGKLILKIYPRFLDDFAPGKKIVLVSGTNGKTTMVHMLTEMLRANHDMVFANESGANMEDGILSSLSAHSLSELRREAAIFIFEVDEAWFSRLCPRLKPTVCLISNFFRDQLDRYGELSATRSFILNGLKACDAACTAVLCGDDPLVRSLSEGLPLRAVYFGMAEAAMQKADEIHLSEAKYCPRCAEALLYDRHAYAHLGQYRCSSCDFASPDDKLSFFPDSREGDRGLASFCFEGREEEVRLGIPGRHNLYNAAGALLTALELGASFEKSLTVLPGIRPSFGRMENVILGGGQNLQIILIKNPIGAEQAIRYMDAQRDADCLYFLLNDKENDGRDVSWIWDVDYADLLGDSLPSLKALVCSGNRAEDMALRLHYAGVPEDKLLLEKDIPRALQLLQEKAGSSGRIYAFPNYTSMLALRTVLKGKGGVA